MHVSMGFYNGVPDYESGKDKGVGIIYFRMISYPLGGLVPPRSEKFYYSYISLPSPIAREQVKFFQARGFDAP